jgi:hypothetical protein
MSATTFWINSNQEAMDRQAELRTTEPQERWNHRSCMWHDVWGPKHCCAVLTYGMPASTSTHIRGYWITGLGVWAAGLGDPMRLACSGGKRGAPAAPDLADLDPTADLDPMG